jgi:ribonucleoside-diphosphate reductase alpha chain
MTHFEDVQHVTVEEYFKDNQFSVDVYKSKYALNENESKHIAFAYKRVCDAIASTETTEELQSYWSKRWFDEIWNDWWKPAGSIMQGAGNKRKCSLCNCTTIAINGDSLDDIFETGRKIAKSAASRQGLGVDISPLRPNGAAVYNAAQESTGSIAWMKWFDNIGHHVGQKGRIPAMLFSINVSHPDVLEFITAKSNLKAVQNANISIQITDAFMQAYVDGKDWELSFEVEATGEKITKKIPAAKLMRMLAEEAHRFAEPGVQFIDTCRAESVTDVLGYPILSTNACSEKFMYPDSTCVLSSINVGKFSSKEKHYRQELDVIGESITRFLDNVVSYEILHEKYPYPEQKAVMEQLRELGAGITNLHAWLFKQELSYDSDEGIINSENFIKYYSYVCWKTSIALGNEKGNCLAFDPVKIWDSPYIGRMGQEFPDLEFETLRNSQNMSFAPAGTLSLGFSTPCISTGVEPCIGFCYWKRTKSSGQWRWYFIVPSFVREYLEKHNVKLPFEGESIEDSSGEVGEKCMKLINKYFKSGFFKPAHLIDPFKKVELMAGFAKWVDSSMSVTYNVPEDFTAEGVEKLYYEAWRQGIKSVAVYRDKSRQGIIEFESPQLVEKRFQKKDTNGDVSVHQIETSVAPVRPDKLKCNLHHVSVQGKKYLVIVGMFEDRPYEIFAGLEEEIEIPAKLKTGYVERVSSRKYNLYVAEGEAKEYIKIKDIVKQFDNSAFADTTRLLSVCLRYGVPVPTVVGQLDKTESDITSFGKAISRVLKHYAEIIPEEACPECKQPSLVSESGCIKCLNCSYSKCA